jgi:hypothetical protein
MSCNAAHVLYFFHFFENVKLIVLGNLFCINKQILKTNGTAFGCAICFFHFFEK